MKLKHFKPGRLLVKTSSFLNKYRWWILFAFLVISFFFLIQTASSFINKLKIKPENLLSFFQDTNQQLISTNGVTNFLLLGIRGEGEDSPNLSDTIMIFSYNHETSKLSLISVPRDLWIPSLRAKINTAYHYGEEASPSAGIALAQSTILENLGLPIHYTAVVSFVLFEDVINLVDGVDVVLEQGFTDEEFPIPGRENAFPIESRYETISFVQGLNHLDGQTALKFVRSRHAEGDEGTDFARSRRQQQVISGIKQKILTPAFLLDKQKMESLIDIVNKNLKANFTPDIYPSFARLALNIKDSPLNIVSLSTNEDKEGVTILYHPKANIYNGEWVLLPKDNNWPALKKYIENKINNSCISCP